MKTTADEKAKILVWLAWQGHEAWGQQTVGVRGRRIAKKSRGIGDIVCILRPSGKHLEIEMKFGRDTQRPDQKAHRQRVEDCGGLYLQVECFDDFLAQFASLVRKEQLTLRIP